MIVDRRSPPPQPGAVRLAGAYEAANSTKDVQVPGETASAGTVRSLESRMWTVWGQVANSRQSPPWFPL